MPSPDRFIVKTSSAKMPSSCKGHYKRIAVIELTPGAPEPKMISERAKGVVRIVQTWEKLNVGGPDSAFQRALVEAEAMAGKLNLKAAGGPL